MAEWCFVHAADLHLDTPFEGIGEVDEAIAARLRDASLAAFDALVELTVARGARFLVVAGDVYDGPERGLRAQLRVEGGLRRLSAHGIGAFVAHGNHDPVGVGWQLVTAWPPGVHVFGDDEVESYEVEHDGTVVAVVQGVSYEQRAERRNLARAFSRTARDVLHVGVLHANVGGNAEHAPYAPCTLDDLRRAGIDYWALGHVHRRQVLLDGTDGDPWAVYPGNLQGRSVRATELGPKGASVVHVVDGAVARVEPVTLDRARFGVVEVAIDDATTLGDLLRRAAAGIDTELAAAGDRIVVLRVRVTGRGPAHDELARPGARGQLLAALRDHAAADVVVADVRDDSAPPAGELDPLVDRLLDGVEPTDAVAPTVEEVAGRRWTSAVPDVEELAAAAASTVRTLLREQPR